MAEQHRQQQDQQPSLKGIAGDAAAADADITPTPTLNGHSIDSTTLPSKDKVTNPTSPSSTPTPSQGVTKSVLAPPQVEEEVEYDDFGLPVFKPAPILLHTGDSSDGEDDEDARDMYIDRRGDDDEASSRTTGSPVREVEEKDDGTRVSIGGRMVERMSLEIGSPPGTSGGDKGGETIPIISIPPTIPVEEVEGVQEHSDEDSLKAEPTIPVKPIDIATKEATHPTANEKKPQFTEDSPKPINTASTEAVTLPKDEKVQDMKDIKPEPSKPAVSIPSISIKEEQSKTLDSPKDLKPMSPTTADLTHASPLNPITAITQQTTTDTDIKPVISSWSHQQSAATETQDESRRSSGEWQEMPSYAPYDIYNDDGKLIAKEHHFSDDEGEAAEETLGGASKGYTRVQMDEDAQSATSMDDNTGYLFKEVENPEDEQLNPLSQLETTKDLLTEGQRIAYVGLCKLAMMEMRQELEKYLEVRKSWAKKSIAIGREHMKMWSQIIMVRLYKHMDINQDEQLMIEQLSEHGVVASDLTPTLMKNARVKNPMAAEEMRSPGATTPTSPPLSSRGSMTAPRKNSRDSEEGYSYGGNSTPPPAYEEEMNDESVKMPSELPDSKTLDIDIRWTVLCDLFLVLISDSVYDARSRVLLELVGKHLSISWIDICKFEKKVTDALEMQESAAAQNWNESDILVDRAKRARNKRYAMMGLATLGGGIVIGLSAGLLAPVIGAGLAAGFTTIGITSTGAFLGGAGGAAIITTTAAVSGSAIAGKAAGRRTQSVSVFEFRPLYNSKRVNLIVTISGWMNGKEDDVRLPYSTVDPIMGDIYSVLWEPEMMQSMGQTINILATEVLTQSLQQVLGSTVLMALMASLQVPLVLTKLSYLLDNPWNVSLDRAWASGLILADTLMHRNLGVRPITLVGFSLGARVIFSCLNELARRNAHGLVQNVYMFGSPVVVNRDEYMAMSAVVRGRFVNGYCTNDWILGYLFRATSGGIGRVAGLAPIENVPGVENFDCTEYVVGHMAYRTAIPKLLKQMDWTMISEEFSEIEEADPDKLRERQTELISEIEAARKELEKEPSKRKWGLFGKNKDVAKKAEWETYAEEAKKQEELQQQNGEGAGKGDRGSEDRDNVLFDVEAIRRELALQEIEERERAQEEKDKNDGKVKPQVVYKSATPSFEQERGELSVPKGRMGPGSAKSGGSGAGTGVSTPNSGYGVVVDKSPAGTTRGSRNFSFGLFGGGRKDSVEKSLVGSQTGSRNSSVMDLSSAASQPTTYQHNRTASSSPDLTRTSPQKHKRGSSGSLEPRSPWAGYSYEDEFGHDDGHVQMTFEDSKWDGYNDKPPPPPPPKQPQMQGKRAVSYWGQQSHTSSPSLQVRGTSPGVASSNSGTSSPRVSYDGRNEWNSSGGGGGALPVLNKGSLGVPQRKSSLGYYSPNPGYQMRSGSEWGNSTRGSTGSVNALLSGGGSMSGPSGGHKDKPLPHNPWNEEDEEEFGHEKEMTLSFE
ncbi:hypothetical protein TWF694_003133 [Orbilia ellipsospora]|uniref:DUF726-domain-containing protein n=1 Tax=Orbilia ellipsospora TaxID=2528407 RepID=A0AAV9X0P8_9PEZI